MNKNPNLPFSIIIADYVVNVCRFNQRPITEPELQIYLYLLNRKHRIGYHKDLIGPFVMGLDGPQINLVHQEYQSHWRKPILKPIDHLVTTSATSAKLQHSELDQFTIPRYVQTLIAQQLPIYWHHSIFTLHTQVLTDFNALHD